jgi:Zn-dependent carboxypeptidase
MERIEQAVEVPKSGIKDLFPDPPIFDAHDLLKSARVFEETMRTTKEKFTTNMPELEKLVYCNRKFDQYLQNFEEEYCRFMDDYSRKVKQANVKKFTEELRIYLHEKSSYSSHDEMSSVTMLPTLGNFSRMYTRNSSLPSNDIFPIQPSTSSISTVSGHRPRPPTKQGRSASVGRQNIYYKG